MLSVILYGRNDQHGYNYHKRLAISLNCIAAQLSDPNDEIIFADYNSPDDFPTLIEAIQDILTDKAKSLIRILRIRPQYHTPFLKKTHLSVLETISRNIAIRRSNPANKWVLATNPDMIFIPLDQKETLSTIVSTLSDGFYLLPRFALPENFWELALDRLHPEKNISFLRDQGQKLHLNTTVRRTGFLKYDNPGDFQLMLRSDIFEIGGFDETMLKGWHVDSNICKRMSLLGRTGESLEKRLTAFHCNHNQKESLVHNKVTENDWGHFIANVSSPQLPNPNWGLPEEAIEEVRLDNRHVQALASALEGFKEKDHELSIHVESFNTVTYAVPRIFPFLADHFCHLSKTVNIGYLGYNNDLLNTLNSYLDGMGFKSKIFCLNGFQEGKLPPSAILSGIEEFVSKPDLYIIDFGIDEASEWGKAIKSSKEGYLKGRRQLRRVMDAFLEILDRKKASEAKGKFIGINVLHTDFNAVFSRYLLVRNSGHATGVSYGYFSGKKKAKQKLTSTAQYFIARYFFNYSDRLRSLLARKKMGKKIFKSLV